MTESRLRRPHRVLAALLVVLLIASISVRAFDHAFSYGLALGFLLAAAFMWRAK